MQIPNFNTWPRNDTAFAAIPMLMAKVKTTTN